MRYLKQVKESEYMVKYIRVTMPDGSLWDVPAALVADDRAQYYARKDADAGEGEYQELYTKELAYTLGDAGELFDWAANNMNWSDVQASASQVQAPPPPAVDYADGWTNGDKRIVEH